MTSAYAPGPVLVFDGDCAFCSSCVRWAERYPRQSLSSAGWDAVAWQFADMAALAEFTGGEVSAERASREVLWVTPDRRVYGGAQALARLLMRSGGLWAWAGGALALAPVRPVADVVYRWVAKNRDRMPGGTPACALPRRS
ncbi:MULTISPECIES: thiol-disulfide oxidoreductase DCC family protein [Kitasatospora]|uniref:thiol-disulfide oxidoreductase DCC family protein n=1 Tax=Kitasatospora TaxID=2063 RepID=UPI0004C2BC45|nr:MULTISPECIES: DCC1-like thiol-disulfide oxidoreductase family protein [unclassified Kitasatospora]WAL70814.1 DCC1-like thiol-disulfide oxidoreductase family protein [Kitasatospora sp. YST-16]WNW36851.1 DCC1-like thiol-disulfide oxidoreductase family protein [Streptomyces sp. Li-HN-5-13]